ncbi:MAG TPA: DNA topoisomerase I, partial [Methanocorpusculum sp.]|nr:DNA topoisomerase I [Methanocorpusculum sp.]
AIFAAGINDLKGLAIASPDTLVAAGLTADEAAGILTEAFEKVNLDRLKEAGIPAVSLKKYIAAGYTNPEKFAKESVDALAKATGMSGSTVERHRNLVIGYLKNAAN